MGCPGVGCRVRRAVITVQSSLLAACTVIAVLINWNLATAQDTRIDAPLPHSVGQSVSPSFEGWYPNANGSFNMVFGYFNRNYDESLDIPVGPNNYIEPAEFNGMQPTHFPPAGSVLTGAPTGSPLLANLASLWRACCRLVGGRSSGRMVSGSQPCCLHCRRN